MTKPVATGSEFQINTETIDSQQDPAVTSLSDGGFVVTWASDGQDGHRLGVYGQLYDVSGAPDGAEFRVNTYTTNDQRSPSVSGLGGGGFVVTWESSDGSSLGIFGQRYDASGVPAGIEFRVNTTTANEQEQPDVTSLGDGGFVVVWQSEVQDGDGYGIYGQRYDENGNAADSEFLINTYITSWQTMPSVTALENGGFVVSWQSGGQDSSGTGIYSQIFSYASADFTSGDDNVTLYGLGQSVNGLGGNDNITGPDYADGSDIINGGAGKDTIEGMAGDDTLNGGANNDTVSYASATSSVIVSLGLQGGAQNTFSAGIDTLSNFENLTGSAFGDNLTGDANANRLDGGAGDDVLLGLNGNDKLYGRSGEDKIDLKAFNFASKAQVLSKFYEIGSGSNDKLGFKYKGTEIIVKGIDMGQLNGADIIV